MIEEAAQMTRLDELYLKMVDYYADDPARIQHFVKVHSFAALIGRVALQLM